MAHSKFGAKQSVSFLQMHAARASLQMRLPNSAHACALRSLIYCCVVLGWQCCVDGAALKAEPPSFLAVKLFVVFFASVVSHSLAVLVAALCCAVRVIICVLHGVHLPGRDGRCLDFLQPPLQAPLLTLPCARLSRFAPSRIDQHECCVDPLHRTPAAQITSPHSIPPPPHAP